MGDGLEPDFAGSPDPIYRLPRPWWHFVFPGLWMLFWFSSGFHEEWKLLQPETNMVERPGEIERPMSPAERWTSVIVFTGASLLAGLMVPFCFALEKPLFAICKQGLMGVLVGGDSHFVPWDQIGPCYWGRYQINRGTLTILYTDGQSCIKIPESGRAEVEAILWRSGKWRD